MEETLQNTNNYVTLSGRVATAPQYSHEIYGEKFYEVMLEVRRLSDITDLLPVSISDRLISNGCLDIDRLVTVVGQFRSYNKIVDNRSKLMLTVFVKDIFDMDSTMPANSIEITGYICKAPIFRVTPFNREICDILLAVNRQYNKSDYIPTIAWGRNARFARSLAVGQLVKISGRIQSRQYQKKLSESDIVTRTAYEVSVANLDINCSQSQSLNSDILS